MENLLERVEVELKKRGGKSSKTRRQVMELFFSIKDHVSVEELHERVRNKVPGIGYATVYRTLKALEELGYATSIEIGDGVRRFENGLVLHHDHLCCVLCKKIIEFSDPEIEVLQKIVSKKHGFKIIDHTLCIYGMCPRCQESGE